MVECDDGTADGIQHTETIHIPRSVMIACHEIDPRLGESGGSDP
jgi:hypothetical protein